jgi:acyl-CoA synthetase (NDP forming)
MSRAGGRDLSSLVSPAQVVLVGASDGSSWSTSLHDNLVAGGYRGQIHLVNPKAEVVHGRPTVRSIADLPEGIDLAFVLIGRDRVESAIVDLADRGVRAAVVLAGGYGEAGDDGASLEASLVETATKHDILVLGPNDMGFINTHDRTHLLAQPIPGYLRAGGVALISQSGAMATLALRYFSGHDIGLSHVVTTGNESMIGVEDVADHLIDDPRVRSLALLIEGVRDPARFRAVAARALLAGKMIVVCKIGRSTIGAAAAAAHTGKLAGSDKVTDAMFRQLGVIRVDSVEDLIATAGAFDEYGAIAGCRMGVVTTSGGAAGLVADLAAEHGIELPAFTEETRRCLDEDVLPEGVHAGNPLDATGHIVMDAELATNVRRAVLADPNIDFALFTYRAAPDSVSGSVAARYRAVDAGLSHVIEGSSTPCILSGFIEEDVTAAARSARAELGLPNPLPSVARAVPALARIIQWTKWRDSVAASPRAEELAPAQIAADVPGPTRWSEWDLRAPLEQAGVPLVPARLVSSLEAAVAAARELGMPVALKVVSADIAHKSDIGGVRLDLRTEAEVQEAYAGIMAAVTAAAPASSVDGVQVAPMRALGPELVVGVVRDPVWGPALSVGLGGIWVEVLGDASIRVLPVGAADIGAMLRELRGWPVISGGRGGQSVDLDAAVRAIGACVEAAQRFGSRLAAFEVNPLRLYPDGAEALDALVLMEDDS